MNAPTLDTLPPDPDDLAEAEAYARGIEAGARLARDLDAAIANDPQQLRIRLLVLAIEAAESHREAAATVRVYARMAKAVGLDASRYEARALLLIGIAQTFEDDRDALIRALGGE